MAEKRFYYGLQAFIEGVMTLEKRFYYGGQAVVEGVMMRGRKTMATAVRRPNGEIAVDVQQLAAIYTGWMRKTPMVRGIIVLIESLALGIKSLLYSANVAMEEEEEKLSGGQMSLVLGVSLVFAVGLFFIVPLFLTRLFHFQSSLVFNLVDGVIRVAILVAYLRLMILIPDIKRTFEFHGAEHATVNAYEQGAAIELETVRGHSKEHVRCGTSFIFVVMVISIIVFALVGVRAAWIMVISRILLIPVIAAISYEVIYFGGRHVRNQFVRAILTPGLWLQALTTRKPDDKQLEVAIAALNKVIEAEEPKAENLNPKI
jgi:uncharacterized protein YqhQ